MKTYIYNIYIYMYKDMYTLSLSLSLSHTHNLQRSLVHDGRKLQRHFACRGFDCDQGLERKEGGGFKGRGPSL